MKRDDGTSKGFGFVSFKNPESAKKAKEAMNGMALGKYITYAHFISQITLY
jgi:polyadenylate-binding protein